jgi:esterase/lipase superfamily enzyme
MLSFLTLSLASLMVMSDRDHFWDADKTAAQTEISWDSLPNEPSLDIGELKDKKVLLVVHGFNNTAVEAMKTYRSIADHFAPLKDADGKPLYDIVVGYLWPGYQNKLDYYAARKHAFELKDKMKSHLDFLSSIAAKVDVLAHSMGNRLIFEALNFPCKAGTKKLVKNLYSIAAAVNQESLEKKHKYSHASKNCEDIFVFHSKQDEVLEFLYAIAEWDKALGFDGVENLKKLPQNVQLIDCTTFVTGHSQYFSAPHVYEFIQSELSNRTPSVKTAPNLKILANGDVEILLNGKSSKSQQADDSKKSKL